MVVNGNIWRRCSHVPLSTPLERLTQLAMQLTLLITFAGSDTSSAHDAESRLLRSLLDLTLAFATWKSDYNVATQDEFPSEPSGTIVSLAAVRCDYPQPDYTEPLHANTLSGAPRVSAMLLCRICELILGQALLDANAVHQDNALQQATLIGLKGASDSLRDIIEQHLCVSDGFVAKAMLLRASCHFLRGWYVRAGDGDRLQRLSTQESWLRSKAPYLDWNALLICSCNPITWLSE